MVAKVLGLASGALVASLAVWAFNDWRHVSDDDRLTTILRDHCLPYVQTGEAPFVGMGRPPGVYDNVDLRDFDSDAGVMLLYGNRFVAQWGVIATDNTSPFRLCDVQPTYGDSTVAAFEVDPDGFIARYTDVIAMAEAMLPEIDTLTDGPRTIGWYGADHAQNGGLRVVMVASPGLVSSVLVGASLAD